MKTQKTVTVFGGSGFLGSHVADSLSERGYRVRVFDLQKSPYLSKDQEMIVGDMMSPDDVAKAVKGASIVYNFAGLADIDDAKNKPLDTVKLNVLGNVLIMEACVQAKVERFNFASTVYVHSDSGSFYRASKQASERFIEAYQERYGLEFTILRYGSLYGRRADARNGIYRLVRQALEKGSITYEGTGEAMREYIHVKDAADASVDILTDEFKNQCVTLTGNEKMKVKDLMAMISEMLQRKVKISFAGRTDEGHYEITPYSFTPRLGRKLIRTNHIDLGQGILDTLADVHEALGKAKS